MAIKVSSAFKDKIYATERKTTANISFEILDITAYSDTSTITVSGESSVSRKSQLMDKLREPSRRYGTFEQDYFLLDGNTYIPPKATDTTASEVGWWNDVLSGANGTFATSPFLDISFTEVHSSMGLTIHFDKKADIYPSDFLIEVFNASDSLITSETVTGNISSAYSFVSPLTDYKRVRFTFTKMPRSSRRVRVSEVDFGIVQQYSGEKLITLKIVEEMDLLSSIVPSNEMQFTLDNSQGEFSILNPDGIYQFLRPNQEMSAEIGLEIEEGVFEYVPMGKFYLTNWTVEEGAMTSTFTGRDIFHQIEPLEYTRLKRSTNLYDLALDVLSEANIVKYRLDEALKTITTVGFSEVLKTREALQMIAIAGKSVVKQDRDGYVVIEQYEEITFEAGHETFAGNDVYAGMTTPKVTSDFDFQLIDFENAYEIPKVTLNTPVKHLKVNYYDLNGVKYTYEYTNNMVDDGIGYEISNPLIDSWAQSLSVIGWMFREYNLLATYQANWRQNPALECGDLLIVQDNYGGLKKSRITKNEFNFQGFLDGTTEAKGRI